MNKLIILFSSALLFTIFGCCSNENEQKESAEKALTDSEKQLYISKGKEIAMTTFNTLSGELKEKITEGGIASAISYCNVAAMPLTDSLSQAYNVEIRRVSDKLRNPLNKPDSIDSKVLAEYNNLLSSGEKLKPVLTDMDDQIRFSAPILVKPACLNCHGEPEKYIANADLELIRERYPNDQAIDYNTGDLRGIWSITFSKE